jgi:exonuclease SbcD
MMTAGNHDSGERVSYGHAFLQKEGIHTAGILRKDLEHVTLQDAYGDVVFWLMPYVFPSEVSLLLDDPSIHDTDTAVRKLIAAQNIDPAVRNVMVAHQNVTAGTGEQRRGGSETMVGGVGEVRADAFAMFDYTALGHIHAAYPVGANHIRYCGSPLCYHFDETRQAAKGPLLVTLGPKGTEPKVELKEIQPLHPMRIIEGSFDDILETERTNGRKDEYVSVTITDRHMSDETAAAIQAVFEAKDSYVLTLQSGYERTTAVSGAADTLAEKSLAELFHQFYTERHGGEEPDETGEDIMRYAQELVLKSDHHEKNDQKEVEEMLKYLSRKEQACGR